MYQLKIIQGKNVISLTDMDVDVLTQFVEANICLFGEETQFVICKTEVSK